MKERKPENTILRSRARYRLTWLALAAGLAGAAFLLVVSWNSRFTGPPSPVLTVSVWSLVSASIMYLFLLAVKKAHRQLVDEERSIAEARAEAGKSSGRERKTAGDREEFDFAATARKLVRRIPDNCSMEEAGGLILKNLAREIEIMSGVFYIRREELFEPVATYAVTTSSGPYSFREGEGLTGQVARNQHVMVLTELPAGSPEAGSGLGGTKPSYLAIVPLVMRTRTIAVLECSGFRYDPHEIENMFRIFSRDVMTRLPDIAPE